MASRKFRIGDDQRLLSSDTSTLLPWCVHVTCLLWIIITFTLVVQYSNGKPTICRCISYWQRTMFIFPGVGEAWDTEPFNDLWMVESGQWLFWNWHQEEGDREDCVVTLFNSSLAKKGGAWEHDCTDCSAQTSLLLRICSVLLQTPKKRMRIFDLVMTQLALPTEHTLF